MPVKQHAPPPPQQAPITQQEAPPTTETANQDVADTQVIPQGPEVKMKKSVETVGTASDGGAGMESQIATANQEEESTAQTDQRKDGEEKMETITQRVEDSVDSGDVTAEVTEDPQKQGSALGVQIEEKIPETKITPILEVDVIPTDQVVLLCSLSTVVRDR